MGCSSGTIGTLHSLSTQERDLRVALHTIHQHNQRRHTLMCDSQLVIMGTTGKASKWTQRDWQAW